ncbi:hypothetical protein Q8A67_020280 [Cirrhinus molitorella]|uniref:Uncharacterized protein n=1 Tax=Cirrhinus molitorella TaxID=172907 RepID=A0AA88TDV3_9TELE|nr:hypothetical protein Q8A67_020280 [Cirrhinus molitorella]
MGALSTALKRSASLGRRDRVKGVGMVRLTLRNRTNPDHPFGASVGFGLHKHHGVVMKGWGFAVHEQANGRPSSSPYEDRCWSLMERHTDELLTALAKPLH